MYSELPRPGRTAARFAAAAVAAPIAAVAFAAPAAAAEVPGLDEIYPDWYVPADVVSGDDSDGTFNLDMIPSAGHEWDFHTVAFGLVFDDPEGLIEILPGDGCEVDAAGSALSCEESARGYYFLDFDLASTADLTAAEPVEYALAIAIDGIEIGSESGTVDVIPAGSEYHPHDPYLHGDAALSGVEPGSTVEVRPTFRQERDLYSGAAAILASFSDSYSHIGISQEGADAVAEYDNCTPSADGIRGGVDCIITDLTNRPGTALTFTGPVSYAVGADALGPFAVCSCTFSVQTIDADTLTEEFGDLIWDPASENLLGIEPADAWTEPADPETAEHFGTISITTTANPVDLTVTGGSLSGTAGTEATTTVQVTNNGPATIYNREDDHGSASIRVQLPAGTQLARINSSGTGDWFCLGKASLALEYSRTTTTLDRYDLYCFLMTPLTAGQTVDFTFTAKLTGSGEHSGLIEIAALTTDVNGANLDSNLANDVASLSSSAEGIAVPRNDFNEDGVQDLFAVRESDGALLLYRGTENATLIGGDVVATGWGHMDVVMPGDVTGDGNSDLLARDTRTGTLYTYPGDGTGGLGSRITSGTGWGSVEVFTAADTDGNGTVDIVAARRHDERLYRYAGDGTGTFTLASSTVGSGQWINAMTNLGDIDGNGTDDLVYQYGPSQEYRVFGHTLQAPRLDPWLGSSDQDRRYSQIAAIGDMDENGTVEVALVDARTGALHRQSFTAAGAVTALATFSSSGWGGMSLPEVDADRTYDYDQNGTTDLLARDKTTGTTYLYLGSLAGGGLSYRLELDKYLSQMDLIEAAGDFTGDNLPDVIARTSGGVLYVYPGDGYGNYRNTARVRIGGGWGAMGAIVSGQDYNNDGKVDILARESATGNLWLYPGTGTGSHGTRVLIGTGWNSMSLITAVGDLDHDGAADVIARKNSDNCLYFYAGKPAGGVKNGVKIGCGWDVMNAVVSVGDFNGDGHVDWIARHTNGNLYLYKGNGAGTYTSSSVAGTGWGGMDLLA
ncbi:FG-GAP repeat domain-containing protein [Glycomyces dulcitolivorans]|uniref:FG-GAP repeat domain-containing protein n=1 Tax=Glycomyces dulcitolivorans TaxID=2200759 RepID=UPI000DD4287C|nr:VCBS repeat-containing protein [Glycomyces dulcitolivorans]